LASKFAQPGMSCIYTSDPNQPFISSGVLDIGLSGNYQAAFLVGNRIESPVPTDGGLVDSFAVTVSGATVRTTNSKGTQLAAFTRLASATVQSASVGVPGYAPIVVTIVDTNTLTNDSSIAVLSNAPLSGGSVRLVAYVSFFGKTLAGESVKSDEFSFPIDVCNGCLITFSNNPAYPIPNCVGVAGDAAPPSSPGVPCFAGQDVPVDCSLCQDVPLCRSGR
jgi:hypothetical protein